jgi:uncharacterized protein (DUF433 family)
MTRRVGIRLQNDPLPLAQDDHGVIRVGGTRVSLESILTEYLHGASPEQIVDSYPVVSLADVHSAISYYLRHRETVEEYLDNWRTESQEMEREMRKRFPTAELRERLARRLGSRSE